MELYLAGYAGLKGTEEIARKKAQELKTYYHTNMVERAKELCLSEKLSNMATEIIGVKSNKQWNVSDCGLYGSLWSLSKGLKKGFEIDLSKVFLKQETIEICEYFDLNPYRLYSTECILFICIESYFEEISYIDNTPIVHIGRTTEKNAKEIHYDQNILYLTPQKEDEMYRII